MSNKLSIEYSETRFTICENAVSTSGFDDDVIILLNASHNKVRWSGPDTNFHAGDIFASIGKRCKISSQKPWIVFTFNISGESIYVKNISRARAISSSVIFLFIAIPSSNSRILSSGANAQFFRFCNMRLRISPAPAFVYVKHKIPDFVISRVRNKIRNSRSVKTLVLPVPAFAWTQTFCVGFAAESCSGESFVFLYFSDIIFNLSSCFICFILV